MSDVTAPGPGVDEILARLEEQGVRLDRADAEAMRPLLASLLARLAWLASSVPDDAPPMPGGGSRFPP